jgi:hypothetical protein
LDLQTNIRAFAIACSIYHLIAGRSDLKNSLLESEVLDSMVHAVRGYNISNIEHGLWVLETYATDGDFQLMQNKLSFNCAQKILYQI